MKGKGVSTLVVTRVHVPGGLSEKSRATMVGTWLPPQKAVRRGGGGVLSSRRGFSKSDLLGRESCLNPVQGSLVLGGGGKGKGTPVGGSGL